MCASVPARFRSMRLVPITITDTGARVVAACEPDPGSFQNTILQPQTSGSAGHRPSFTFASIPCNDGANLFEYEPNVHVYTGERAMIPFCVDLRPVFVLTSLRCDLVVFQPQSWNRSRVFFLTFSIMFSDASPKKSPQNHGGTTETGSLAHPLPGQATAAHASHSPTLARAE